MAPVACGNALATDRSQAAAATYAAVAAMPDLFNPLHRAKEQSDTCKGTSLLINPLQRELPTLFQFFFLCLFRAVPTAYGGSQARGPIGAAAAG